MVMDTPSNKGGYNVIFLCIRSKYCLNGTYLRNISNRVCYVIGILIGVRVRDRASLNLNPTTKKPPHKKPTKKNLKKIIFFYKSEQLFEKNSYFFFCLFPFFFDCFFIWKKGLVLYNKKKLNNCSKKPCLYGILWYYSS